ncbi:GerMN domain-containing protein [Anaerosalibacter massiliensis]|uniref:GerMN domain-containing protein n=1 Tax=Anaerosalibacter massiliensis TaxID=1347392 RepID=A0A9X2MH64_9FIRM|nr:GerMN domain-containing protein [Anaerosalibacter massiliensis]MCR2043564.1 GerMN domain-containing protein [Anaerosalibacter massiliensis]
MKKYIAIFLSIIMILSLTACTSSKNSPETSSNNRSEDSQVEQKNDKKDEKVDEKKAKNDKKNDSTSAKKDIEKSEEKNNVEEVNLYFVNKDYIETGDESLEKLIPEKRIIEYKDITLEEAIVRELIKGPESISLSTGIPPNIELIDVKVSDGIISINFAQEGLHGGSMEEQLTLNQIIKTLLELDNVNKVQFLVNGEKAETLMDHFDISEPFTDIME